LLLNLNTAPLLMVRRESQTTVLLTRLRSQATPHCNTQRSSVLPQHPVRSTWNRGWLPHCVRCFCSTPSRLLCLHS